MNEEDLVVATPVSSGTFAPGPSFAPLLWELAPTN